MRFVQRQNDRSTSQVTQSSSIKFFYRQEAENMCKMLATSNYALLEHEDLGMINYLYPLFMNNKQFI